VAETDADVFRALADPSRRRLLDLLRERDGQSLGELTAGLTMARQSVAQHLGVLEGANLVSTVWHGRQKLHFLNPVPLHDVSVRWLSAFDRPRLVALDRIRQRAEELTMTDRPIDTAEPDGGRPTFRYATYIRATPEAVWRALTDADLTAAYWGHSNVSDWRVGSAWEHQRTDGSGIADVRGTVVTSEPPTRLSITFDAPGTDAGPADSSLVTFEIEPFHEIVRLTLTHERIPSREDLEEAAAGWSSVLSNLKTLLETGEVLPQAPWEMHADEREANQGADAGR
jgi:uncharacterized protein YndB with AHSA1/START domain/DNA-binding transcriptional ArsR family regulator